MRIDRGDLLDLLGRFALAGHGVITGSAGVGKTVAVNQLTQRMLNDGRGVVLVSVGDLGAATNDDIASAIPHTGDILNALAVHFAGHRNTPGLMIVDGFDAARDPIVRERVLRLIRRFVHAAAGRWHVIVTVRPYDAAKSPDLLSLFANESSRSAATRLIEIPLLSSKEVDSVTSSVSGFRTVVTRASPQMRELLRLPFNLWLVEQILRTAGEEAVDDLSSVDTDAQLLDRFWRTRVSGGLDGESRAAVARLAAQAMATSQALVVATSDVWSNELQGPWDSLLSAEVLSLVGPADSRVSFRHNVLFDYATSLYVLSSEPVQLRRFLTTVPSRALFLRPSLLFLFTNLWEYERERFWKLFRGVADEAQLPVRLVSRLIPPYVLASEARSLADLRPLLQPGWRDSARLILWVLQGARFAPEFRPLVWAKFLSYLSSDPEPLLAWEVTILLQLILSRTEEEQGSTGIHPRNRETRSNVAQSATSLLSHALTHRGEREGAGRWWDTLGARQALPLVIDTMDIEPERAIDLLRSILSLLEEPDVPIWYFLTLSQRITRIVEFAPGLARDIYRTVFSYVETSEAPTSFGGAVLRLQGTRRQDYEGVQYGLVREYPGFVADAPIEAIQGGLYAGCLDVLRDGILRHVEPGQLSAVIAKRTRPIVLAGIAAEWLEDESTLWPNHGRDDGVRLIEAAAHGVARLAQDGDSRLNTVLREYIGNAFISLAVARLLDAASEAPSGLAGPLRELALQRSVQTSLDLRQALGQFLRAASPHWTSAAKEEVETSILSLEANGSVKLSTLEKANIVDLLIGAIPRQSLVTPPAIRRATALKAAGGAPFIEPPIRFEAMSSSFTQEDWLTEQGVDPGSPPNKALRKTFKPLVAFQNDWRNATPTDEPAREVEAALKDTVDALAGTLADDLVVREAWTAVAGTAATLARMESLGPSHSRWNPIRDLLITALAEHPSSVDADADAAFTTAHWSPSPQTEAIQGLGSLLAKADDATIVDHLQRIITRERDPALRFLACRYLPRIFLCDPKRFWHIAETLAEAEANPVVMATLLDPLGSLAWNHAAEVRRVLEVAWPRWMESDHKELLRGMASVFLVLAAHAEDSWAMDVLGAAFREPIKYDNLLGPVFFRSAASLSPDASSDPQQAHTARLRDILSQGVDALKDADIGLKERQAKGENLAGARGRIHQLVDTVATRLDVNLRFDSRVQKDDVDQTDETRDSVIRPYYSLVWPVISNVLEFGEATGLLMAPTAHHLLELFNVLLKVDAAAIVVAANRAVQAAKGDNYNLDSLAIREVVTLMETVLADHRDVLIEGPSMEAALSLLDTFAEAGWTEALQLIWRLDEAFR